MNGELNRQQLCALLNISESTVRRLENQGLPYTQISTRTKRYDMPMVKQWLGEQQCQHGKMKKDAAMSVSWSKVKGFTESFRSARLRVMPS